MDHERIAERLGVACLDTGKRLLAAEAATGRPRCASSTTTRPGPGGAQDARGSGATAGAEDSTTATNGEVIARSRAP